MSGPYLTALARQDVGENGVIFDLGPFLVTAKSFFPFCIGLSVFLQVFLLPVLGAIADYTNLKKRLMAFFCYAGSAATCLLFFVSGDRYLAGGLLLIVANLCFGASLVLYNAFLNDITTEDRRDKVSSRGYALGYLGGGVLLLANLALLQSAGALGISEGLAVRLSLCSAGLWWGGFSIITFRRLRTRSAGNRARRHLGTYRGRQGVAGVVPRAAPSAADAALSPGVHAVQRRHPDRHRDGVAVPVAGALRGARAAGKPVVSGRPDPDDSVRRVLRRPRLRAHRRVHRHEARDPALAGDLDRDDRLRLWVAADDDAGVGDGSRHRDGAGRLAGAVALAVLADDSRRPGSIVFRVYEISERGTSWIGPILFGMVAAATNSYRQAILSLIVLFLGGMIGLILTDTESRHRRGSGAKVTPFPQP